MKAVLSLTRMFHITRQRLQPSTPTVSTVGQTSNITCVSFIHFNLSIEFGVVVPNLSFIWLYPVLFKILRCTSRELKLMKSLLYWLTQNGKTRMRDRYMNGHGRDLNYSFRFFSITIAIALCTINVYDWRTVRES